MQVILVDYGGVENKEQSFVFLKNMFSDKRILPVPFFIRPFVAKFIALKRKDELVKNYEKIGYSPLKKTVKKIVENLNLKQKNFTFSFSFLYLPPYLTDLSAFLEDAVIFPLFPHFSTTTWGSVLDRVKNQKDKKIVLPYYNNEEFISLIEKRIKKAIQKSGKEKTAIMFTAHSIPEFLTKKDPYIDQVKEQVDKLKQRFDIPVFLGFQSRLGPVKWVSPFIEDVIQEISKQSFENVVVFPLSFVIDNSETLYELDIYLKNLAEEKGIKNFLRVPLFNDDKDFLTFLLNYVEESVKGEKWLKR
ncbi:ferrochelatase [Thermotomaculum hydrothermale]|uniref:coproporphyrin ferrochelatase n=1 Tax=Thermotomaculum hydrothermale TaxID=981385 RepID=A0A7R6SZ97_9BACT|nr:ferrochelatase [Thermotomaculum hydrothermale]BBB33505.1 ferrochelatase [Thermotomaculum hydrothermale]